MKTTHTEHFDGLVRGAVGSLAGLAIMSLYFKAAETLGERTDGSGKAENGESPGPLEARHEQKLGRAVHWGYGVLVGGLYGAIRPEADGPDLAAGLGYGTALWMVGDEITVPLLGLSEGPTGHSVREHVRGLGAHLAYGAATASATQALKRVM